MESLELYGDNGIIFNSVAKAFREAHLEKSVKFEATDVKDLSEKFKNAVKDQYDAKHLDDASAVLIFYENQKQPAEQEDGKEETTPENNSAEDSSTEKTPPPDDNSTEDTPPPENDKGEGEKKEEPPAKEDEKEDEKEDKGEKKEEDKEKKKVDESFVEIDTEIPTWAAKVTGAVNSACGFSDCDKEYTKKALLATLISLCGGEFGLCECLNLAKKYMNGKTVAEAEMTATGTDLQKKILDTVKRVMFSDELEISPLNDYMDKNVSFIKLPIKEMNG